MPPKKATAAKADAGEDGDKAFRWSAENERKLLLFTHTFHTISTGDFERLLEHFPGTNLNGIKIRYSRLRVEKAKLAEQYGLAVEDTKAATPKGDKAGTPKATPKGRKRGAKDDGGEAATPSAKKGKKSKVEDVASEHLDECELDGVKAENGPYEDLEDCKIGDVKGEDADI
ncbi:hypothetical protein N0V90_001935 [Kalmusia sp. IMI 367209]|nr:hypothetical protein N0V90_001935 [Kalmusia sp. IMI 367209]